MPTYILKASPDEDLYVEWSTIVDCPVGWGTRKETHAYDPNTNTEERLDRADKDGTSALWGNPPAFGWDDEEFVVYSGLDTPGTIKRSDLKEFCLSYDEETNRFDGSFVIPFEEK